MTRPHSERKVHWTPDTFSRSTACGRFVAMSGPRAMHFGAALLHSDDKAEVTCSRCRDAIHRAETVVDPAAPCPYCRQPGGVHLPVCEYAS